MDNIRKNRIIRISVSLIGLIYVLNMQFKITNTQLLSIIPLIALVVLHIYLYNSIFTYICGVLNGLIFLVCAFMNFNLFENLLPMVFDMAVGFSLLGFYGYKLYTLKSKKDR